jgi:hypothetical protein
VSKFINSPKDVERSRKISRLQKVTDVRVRELRVKKELEEAVEAARANGCTWQEVADALGTKPQSAHERFQKTITQGSLIAR